MGRTLFIVITGNGLSDIRILDSAVSKYDHSKTLCFPLSVFGIGIKTGIEGAIDTLITLVHRLVVNNYLIIIDREHFKDLQQVISSLKERGCDIENIDERLDGAYILDIRRGGREIRLYIVVFGFTDKGRIEENISELIKIKFNEDVEPNKSEIRSWLRKRGMRDKDLIQQATEEELQESLPTLTTILCQIAKDP